MVEAKVLWLEPRRSSLVEEMNFKICVSVDAHKEDVATDKLLWSTTRSQLREGKILNM